MHVKSPRIQPGCLIRLVACYWLGGWDSFLDRNRYYFLYCLSETGSEAFPDPCPMDNGVSFPEAKRLGMELVTHRIRCCNLQYVRKALKQWKFYLLFTLYALYIHPDTLRIFSAALPFPQCAVLLDSFQNVWH
jgi:hypothetical protein